MALRETPGSTPALPSTPNGLPSETASGRLETSFRVQEAEQKTKLTYLASAGVAAGIASIAYADFMVEGNVSLGFLYLLPLTLSALHHRLGTTLLLAGVCVALREWLGPYEHFDRHLSFRIIITLSALAVFAVIVHRMARKQRKLAETIREQHDLLAEDLSLAETVQRRLLPQQAPELSRLDIAAWMQPARGVGGDHYDFIQVGEERLVVAISDVSGKGLAAAIIMPAVWMALRVLAPVAKSPVDVVTRLNKLMCEVSDSARFVTLFYADFHPADGHLRYVNAGHLAPLLVRRGSQQVIPLETGGPVVGLLPQVGYEMGEVALETGDTLVLFTDGLAEAANAEGVEYSTEALPRVLTEGSYDSAEQLLDRIRESAVAFAGDLGFEDDATLIVIRVRD